MKIIGLDINGMKHPIGIDDTNPIFHFWTEVEENGEEITSVSFTVYKENQKTIYWSTGMISYEKSNYCKYSGPSLEPKTTYYVQVSVCTSKNKEAKSQMKAFETGFLGSEWKAIWIEPEQETAEEEESLSFMEMLVPNPKFWGGEARLKECKKIRKRFLVKEKPVRARVYASAHGIYNLYLNGKKQSERRFAPENSAYSELIYYQTYDVTDELTVGENELSLILADGWWIGRLGLSGESCNYGNRLGAIAQLEITYSDASKEIIGSDESFESQGSMIRYSDLYIGEKLDLTYKNDSWSNCSVISETTDSLLAQPIDYVRCTDELDCKCFITTPEGDLVADFGQVIAGVISITIDGKAGQEVSFEHGEVLSKEGNFVNNIIGRNKDQKDILVCGDGVTTSSFQFTYHGFRYVRIKGASKEQIKELKALVLGTDLDETGWFECSDERINQLQHCIKWSEKANMFSVPTDCPQREKLGWTGDIQVFTKTGAFNYELRNFLSGWLRNLRIEQEENGEIPVVCPNPPKQEMVQRIMSGGSNSSSVWGDACVLVPWYLYETYGDASVLEENYEMMKKWLSYIKESCEKLPEGYETFSDAQKERNPYLWTKQYHFGDWLIPSLRALPDGVQRGTEETAKVVGASYYAVTASYFARVCRALGKTTEAKEYEELTSKIQNAVREEFVSEDGIVNGSSLQGLYVVVLKAGIVQGALKEKVINQLVDSIHANGDCLDTGFSSVSYLLDTLYENGQKDLAFKILFQENAPSWLYMISNGATTMWENWVAITTNGTPTDSSYNHYAFGCVGDFIYRRIGGLQMEGPGYKKIRFAPDFSCGLSHSSCKKMTPYGLASIEWKCNDDSYTVFVEVPVGTTAVVEIMNCKEEVKSGRYQFTISKM